MHANSQDACHGAGTVCLGPACQFNKAMIGREGSNLITVAVEPQTVGEATNAHFRLRVENVQKSFTDCEDNVRLHTF